MTPWHFTPHSFSTRIFRCACFFGLFHAHVLNWKNPVLNVCGVKCHSVIHRCGCVFIIRYACLEFIWIPPCVTWLIPMSPWTRQERPTRSGNLNLIIYYWAPIWPNNNMQIMIISSSTLEKTAFFLPLNICYSTRMSWTTWIAVNTARATDEKRITYTNHVWEDGNEWYGFLHACHQRCECIMSVVVSYIRVIWRCACEMSQCHTSEWYGYRQIVCVGSLEWVIWIPCLSPEIGVCDVSHSVVHKSHCSNWEW